MAARDRFPLWLHPTGQWCKKYKGRPYYFGTQKDEALKRFVAEWDDIKAGRPRNRPGSPAAGGAAPDLSLGELVDLFLTARRASVDAGELTVGSWNNYHQAAGRIVGVLGKGRMFGSLQPSDFGRLRAAAAATLGPNSLTLFLALARTIFGYGGKRLNRPVPYGDQFDRPPRRVVRLHREARGPRLLSAADLRRLIQAAPPDLKAQILLGLNCAYGATDCSDLTRADLAERPGWLSMVRKKTGAPRRCPLWPETVEALRAAAAVRPAPADPSDADRVFLTGDGLRCVRQTPPAGRRKGGRSDTIGRAWKRLCKRLKVPCPRGAFYTLRHIHRTVADEVRDRPAMDIIMGHVDPTMAAFYREEVKEGRLRAVADHVRAWLWPRAKGRKHVS